MNENADEPANDRVACHHDWQYIADEQGDAHEARLYQSVSWMECTECGETRDIYPEDMEVDDGDI